MIVVTGATGHLGQAVVKCLLKWVSEAKVAIAVRDPAKADSLAQSGIEVRYGDYQKPNTLEDAFRKVERLLLISTSGLERSSRVQQHCNAITAAQRAGVKHIFYTSLLPGEKSHADVLLAHQDTEQLLRESGLPFTILRNAAYAESYQLYTGPLDNDRARVPGDGPVAWVAREDLAEATAKLLAEGGHEGETLTLTGPEMLDLAAICDLVGNLQNRTIRRQIVDKRTYIAEQIAAGTPAERAKRWVTTYDAMREGDFAQLDDTLEALIERPRRTMRSVLTELLSTGS